VSALQFQLLYNPYQHALRQALGMRTPLGNRVYNRFGKFAGRRGGKTLNGGICVVEESLRKAGSVIWCAAPTYQDLHDVVIPAVLPRIPPGLIVKPFTNEHKEIILQQDRIIAFRSFEDPEKARGPGLDGLWIDEGAKIAELAHDVALPAVTDKRGFVLVTTTPKSFDWCYRKYWRPALDGEPGAWACKYKTIENPAVDPAEVEAQRKVLDPLFFQQEYESDFVTFTGAVYPNLWSAVVRKEPDYDSVAVERENAFIRTLFPEWPRINPNRVALVGMDPGADHPFGAVLFVMSDRGLVLVGEYLERNRPMAEHKRGIMQMLAKFSPAMPFQPSHFAIDRSQKQAAIELAQTPFPIYTTGAENDVVAGIERVKSWMHAGQFWILERFCPKTVEQMASYQWAENTDKRGEKRGTEKVKKINDDLCDPVRYGVMTWPSLPVPDEASDGRRDLSSWPEYDRWAVERMRRIDDKERALREGKMPGIGEFFDSGYSEVEQHYVGSGSPFDGFWG
jgi:hypothetical protein